MAVILRTAEENERALAHGLVLCSPEDAEEYLMHYRVGGEKKGIRRWQDKSGSLTPEGYKHYAEMYGWNKKVKKAEKLQAKADKAARKAEKHQYKADMTTLRAMHKKARGEDLDRWEQAALERETRARESEIKARIAQRDAVKYADKLQRKEDRMSKYVDENGNLTKEAEDKYAYATPNPGEKRMSLLGRIKFGNEYSNKYNESNKMKMTKEEYKEWEKKEKEKFDEDIKKEAADLDLNNRMNKYNKLDEDSKNRTMSEVEKKIEDYEKKEGNLTKYEAAALDALLEWSEDQKSKDTKTVWRFVEGTKAFHDDEIFNKKIGRLHTLNEAEKRATGDEMLRRINEDHDNLAALADGKPLKNKDLIAEHEEDIEREFNMLRTLVVDTVFDECGSINANDYIPGTNAYNASNKERDARRELISRENQIKKEIGFRSDAKKGSSKYKAEAKRLEAALKKDGVWAELNEAWEKSTSDVFGAILKDIGFSDTPANRSLLYMYGWYD